MANVLAKLSRFNGAYFERYPTAIYSIAQHCVVGADLLFKETGDRKLAGYFLLHDAHEYLIGDIPRPVAKLLDHVYAAEQRRRFQGRGGILPVSTAIDVVKASLDDIIHTAAALPPLKSMPLYARQVSAMDDRMLRAEGLVLFGSNAKMHLPDAEALPVAFVQQLAPWGALPSDPKKASDKTGYAIAKAEFAFVDRLDRYLNIIARG